MKNPFTAPFRARDKPQDSVSAAPVFYFSTSDSGKSVTVQSAIQLSTVYACYFREAIASLPPGAMRRAMRQLRKERKSDNHPLFLLRQGINDLLYKGRNIAIVAE